MNEVWVSVVPFPPFIHSFLPSLSSTSSPSSSSCSSSFSSCSSVSHHLFTLSWLMCLLNPFTARSLFTVKRSHPVLAGMRCSQCTVGGKCMCPTEWLVVSAFACEIADVYTWTSCFYCGCWIHGCCPLLVFSKNRFESNGKLGRKGSRNDPVIGNN